MMPVKRSVPFLYVLLTMLCVLTEETSVSIAGETEFEEVLTTLKTQSGAEYTKSRDAFLRLEGAKQYLESHVNKHSNDWLAYALLQRFATPLSCRMYRNMAVSTLKYDGFKGENTGLDIRILYRPMVFAWQYQEKRIPLIVFPDPLYKGSFSEYSYRMALALDLEWVIRNPDSMAGMSRFWYLFQSLARGPVEQKDFRGWADDMTGYDRKMGRRLRVDHELIQAWLLKVLREEKAPEIQIAVASQVPGKISDDILIKLSQKDSVIGTLAAFLYAGQIKNAIGIEGRHSFDARWLEAWIRKLKPKQLAAVEALFVGNDRKKRSGYMAQINDDLNIPDAMFGLVLRHHQDKLSQKFKGRFLQEMKNDLQSFQSYLDGYPNNWGKYPPETAKELANMKEGSIEGAKSASRSHIAWPRSFADELAKIKTKDKEALDLINAISTALKARKEDMPTASDLQAAYGNAQVQK